jgi:short-subunit dehydrogenase
MGRHIALAFADAGFDLALIARSAAGLEEVAAEARARGAGTVAVVTADATDEESLGAALSGIERELGTPTVAIYNVATMVKTPPSKLSADEIIATLPAMFFGALHMTGAVLPGMRRRGSGTLLYTGGGFGILPARFTASHSVGKAALRNWVQNLHDELREEGINAATVTITRPVTEGGLYDGATIAGHYLTLHRQAAESPVDQWDWEIIHREL